MKRTWSLLALALLSVPVAAAAETTVRPLALPEVAAEAVSLPPMRLAESLSVEPAASLRRAAEGAVDRLEALKARNASGERPVQTGFSRPLAAPLRLRLDAGSTAPGFRRLDGGWFAESMTGSPVWGTHVRVEGAWRLRLHLERVELPAGTRLWVWGLGGKPRPFGLELLGPDGDLWTPSVRGEDVFLEVELPADSARSALEIREVGEIFRLGAGGAPALDGPVFEPLGECIEDASCVNASTFGSIADARKAVAHLGYVSGGDFYVCSGGLLNDSVAATAVPYLLTANHCFSTQGEASSLEAYWDYRTASCGGSFPDVDALPRSNGGTLLATAESTDFTLVRLNSIPGGRVLLGWTTGTLANGTVLHRLSHPAPDGDAYPQSYSQTAVSNSVSTCQGSPRPRYLYALPTVGGTFGGSSGSPVMTGDGLVVGQLTGGCGEDPEDGCAEGNTEFDGAFAATYPSISGFLNPVATGPCTPDADTLCIDDQAGDRRFRVRVSFSSAQASGNGKAVPLSSLGVNSGGLFWFFGASNPEMLVKVLNGCGLNNKYWVFWSAGTNVGLTLTVTDTVTGSSKTYTNPNGKAAAPVQDTSALPCS